MLLSGAHRRRGCQVEDRPGKLRWAYRTTYKKRESEASRADVRGLRTVYRFIPGRHRSGQVRRRSVVNVSSRSMTRPPPSPVPVHAAFMDSATQLQVTCALTRPSALHPSKLRSSPIALALSACRTDVEQQHDPRTPRPFPCRYEIWSAFWVILAGHFRTRTGLPK